MSGQECFGSAATAWQVESVSISGAGLAGAAGFLGLVPWMKACWSGMAMSVCRDKSVRARSSPARASPSLASPRSDSDNGSDNDGSKGANGTKPMNPWDFRTSSPPG